MSAQPESDATPHPLIGTSIGKYKISRLIGMGGMGAVFEALHTTLNQRVAIKVLHAKLTADKESVQRFMNEAHTTSLVHHVGLVKVHDYGQLDDGAAYMMMEYLEGESLRARLAKVNKLLVPDALRVTRQIAAALAAAHEKGVVHRDLKPENVLLVPDPETPSGERAKVLDFGIAKVMEPEGGEVLKTTTGAILGTPTYMSPEQCRGIGKTSDKSDVYSLGCMLYQMLSGTPPFVGSGSGDLIAQHIMEQPKPLREVVPGIAPEIDTLVHQMLEKKPEVRPSMRQVLASLEQLGLHSTASGTGAVVIVQPPPSVLEKPEEIVIKKSSPLPVILGVAGVLAMAAAGLIVMNRPQQTQQQQQTTQPTGPATTPPTTPPAPAQVTLAVNSEPSGAEVLSSPELRPLGTTPWKSERPAGQGKLEVVVRLKGYYEQKLIFDGAHDDTRPVKLAVMPPPPGQPGPVDPNKKNPPIKKPWFKPFSKPATPPPGHKKADDDLDVPVVR